MRQQEKEKKVVLILAAIGLLFSFISFIAIFFMPEVWLMLLATVVCSLSLLWSAVAYGFYIAYEKIMHD